MWYTQQGVISANFVNDGRGRTIDVTLIHLSKPWMKKRSKHSFSPNFVERRWWSVCWLYKQIVEPEIRRSIYMFVWSREILLPGLESLDEYTHRRVAARPPCGTSIMDQLIYLASNQ